MKKFFKKLGNTIGNRLSSDLINPRIAKQIQEDSNLVNHAIEEMKLLGYYENDDTDNPNVWMREQIVDLMTVFANHGNSGFSASYAINLFNKLSRFKTIAPLTFEDVDFNETYLGAQQHKRRSAYFKDDKGVYNIDAFVKDVTRSKYFGQEEIVEHNKVDSSWSGTVYEMTKGIANGKGFRRCYIKLEDGKPFVETETIRLPVLEVEVQKDDWMMFVEARNPKLQALKKAYDIEYIKVPELKRVNVLELTKSY